MRRLTILILCSLGCCIITAQKQIQGTVLSKSSTPVSFATVAEAHGNATQCDSLGNFTLALLHPGESDVLLVQALGYYADTINIDTDDANIQIWLRENVIGINEVAILAQQSIESKSAVSAFTTNKKEISRLNPQNICEVLQTKTGFTNKSGYQAPLTLRGMSGKRILVLRNGNRRFSSYPSGVMSHTINVYDLERIEVEKGAASVIYGAGAMAGIINLVDKSPFRQEGFNAKLTTGYGSVNQEKNLLACGGWSDGEWAVKAGLRYRNANNFKYPDGLIAKNSFYSDKDLFVTTGYKFSQLQNLVFTADIHDGGPWGKPVGFNGSDYMRVQTQKEKSNNYSLKYTHIDMGIFQNVEFNVFYSDESRCLVKNYYTAAGYHLSYSETTHFSDYYYGSFLKGKIDISKKYSITTGAEVYSFHISTPTDVIDYIESLDFGKRVSHNARSINSGLFMHNDIHLNKKIKLTAGIRYNYASVYEGDAYSDQSEERNDTKKALSGNIAASVIFSKHSKLKLNIARSFRMPETTELYTDNYTSNGILYGNPDLKPEYCYSFDMGYQLELPSVRINLSPFLWFMDDMITKEEISGMPGTNYTYVNINRTRMFGGEADVKLNINEIFSNNDKLVLRAGFAYLNGTDITALKSVFDKGIPLDYVPPFNIKSDVSYQFMWHKNLKINMALRSIYYTEQKRLGESPYATPDYMVLGCNMSLSFIKLKIKPTINMAVNNLLNKEYYCYQSYLPSEGRDIRLFLTLNF